ncbi:MAG: polyamine aminopropyltransferase [Chitinispirillaceae bacterium]|nr:polyamine aminopropyltransferase [Chitinispirillaceae bacterium]
MNSVNFQPVCSSNLWIEHLVNGLSGLSIKAKHAVFCDSSPFQKIEIFDTYNYGLVLCLGGSIVMTERDSFIYHEMFVHPPMLMHPEPKSVCVIGGGDGGCLGEILKHSSVKKITLVEIDNMVTETVKRFYPGREASFSDPRVTMVFDDGYHYLSKNEDKFDVIIVDSYDPAGPVQSLETADFYSIVSQRCGENGIVVFQTDTPVIRKEYTRMVMSGVSPQFSSCKPYICPVASFPDSLCSFLLCTNTEQLLENFSDARFAGIADLCEYYNEEMHKGLFLLPQYIKNILKQ